ncbi:putative uncharacterized transporter [Paramyrothecium foliicola]|nr:putative uncharacterized transporter [Paramyrothecium foliicola]
MLVKTFIASALGLCTLAAGAPSNKDSRPCGLRIAPCEAGTVCVPNDPLCTNLDRCLGTCQPTPRPITYQSCGGKRATPPPPCPRGTECRDDPRDFSGCGLACDKAGICIPVDQPSCAGFLGEICPFGMACHDVPGDDCDPLDGGSDCMGVCLHWIHRVLTPKNCRWNRESPPPFTTGLCLLYAVSAAFTVANLYYNQPVLNKIAQTFDVSYETSSRVSTLSQAGYAAGLVFVLPLGDILERRLFIISLVFFTATLWIGLCITKSFVAFQAISFICSMTTVTPQLMIPLVGDFAPPRRKATALSVVVSGLLFGVLIARLLAGVVANFTDWRNIYWLACGMQYLLGLLLFFFLPDYPSTNPNGLGYFDALWSIPYMMVTEPVLVQASVIAFLLSGVFTSFWTTLTFLLASPPYEFSPLHIGLFSLIGVVIVVVIPFVGSAVDRFEPLLTSLVAQLVALVSTIIGTLIGTSTIAGPIIEGMGIDVGYQTVQVANRAAVFNINPKARNRLNTAYMASAFAGQLTGTAVGNRLYAMGGWKMSGYYNIGLAGASIVFALLRGPNESGWVGWRGGLHVRNKA